MAIIVKHIKVLIDFYDMSIPFPFPLFSHMGHWLFGILCQDHLFGLSRWFHVLECNYQMKVQFSGQLEREAVAHVGKLGVEEEKHVI